MSEDRVADILEELKTIRQELSTYRSEIAVSASAIVQLQKQSDTLFKENNRNSINIASLKQVQLDCKAAQEDMKRIPDRKIAVWAIAVSVIVSCVLAPISSKLVETIFP